MSAVCQISMLAPLPNSGLLPLGQGQSRNKTFTAITSEKVRHTGHADDQERLCLLGPASANPEVDKPLAEPGALPEAISPPLHSLPFSQIAWPAQRMFWTGLPPPLQASWFLRRGKGRGHRIPSVLKNTRMGALMFGQKRTLHVTLRTDLLPVRVSCVRYSGIVTHAKRGKMGISR